MSQREIDRLLWDLVDGSISAEDRARVEARLAGDAAARERLAEMQALSELLGSVGELAVPEALPAKVSRALAGKPAPGHPYASPWLWLGELFAPRWRVRLAWAAAGLAVGIAAGILAVADLRKPPAEEVSRFYGAMTHSLGGGAQGLRLALADASGALTLQRDGRILLIELAMDRRGEAPVILELGGNDLMLSGLQAGGQASIEVGSEGDRIALTLDPVSRSLLRVAVPGGQGPVALRVSAGEGELLERTVRMEEIPPL